MGSEVSAEETCSHENGDIKKDDGLHDDQPKKSEPEQKSEKHQNGDIRNRKTEKASNKTKADLKRSSLKAGTKTANTRKQQKALVSKLLTATNAMNRCPWLLKLLVFVGVVGIAFATRLFNLSMPAHIW